MFEKWIAHNKHSEKQNKKVLTKKKTQIKNFIVEIIMLIHSIHVLCTAMNTIHHSFLCYIYYSSRMKRKCISLSRRKKNGKCFFYSPSFVLFDLVTFTLIVFFSLIVLWHYYHFSSIIMNMTIILYGSFHLIISFTEFDEICKNGPNFQKAFLKFQYRRFVQLLWEKLQWNET